MWLQLIYQRFLDPSRERDSLDLTVGLVSGVLGWRRGRATPAFALAAAQQGSCGCGSRGEAECISMFRVQE